MKQYFLNRDIFMLIPSLINYSLTCFMLLLHTEMVDNVFKCTSHIKWFNAYLMFYIYIDICKYYEVFNPLLRNIWAWAEHTVLRNSSHIHADKITIQQTVDSALTSLTHYWIFIRPISTVVCTVTDVYRRDTNMILAPATRAQLLQYNLQV